MADSETGGEIRSSHEYSHTHSQDDSVCQSPEEEIREWMSVNRKLRKQGFHSVRILPSEGLNVFSGRYVCIDLESSQALRSSIMSLMCEVDDRDMTVQELVQVNSQLRDEVAHLTGKTEMLTAKVKDIKVMLECSRARVQELEKETSRPSFPFSEENEKVLKDKSAMAVRCRQMEAKILEQDKELSRLRREILIFAQGDEFRNKRQNQVSVDIKNQTTKTQSGMDEKSEMKDYRCLAQRLSKLEALLNQHNISIPGERRKAERFSSQRKLNLRLEHLESLPLKQCQQFLRDVCMEVGTDNLDCLVELLRGIKDEEKSCARFRQYCQKLCEIVESINDCHHHHRRELDKDVTAVLSDSNISYYLQVIENWCKDISALGELQDAINHLLDKAVPWIHARMEYDHSVPEMIELIERVIHADKSERKLTLMEDVSRSDLETIVSHFQTLFDVPKICGILPCMNDIYKLTGETNNVLNTLKNILGLKSSASTSLLVDAVGRLCHRYNSTTAQQLKKLLETDDLNGVIRRLHEHSKFFPAFQVVIEKLFDILGVSTMDEIVPAVRALKLLAS